MRENFVPFGVRHGIVTIPEISRPSGGVSMSIVIPEKKSEKYISILFTIFVLFTISSIFQTLAWYFNIDGKYAFFVGFAVSIIFVLFEYIFMLPANSLGYTVFSIFQLSILIEFINWTVFIVYLKYIRKEKITMKGWIALVIIFIGVIIGYM